MRDAKRQRDPVLRAVEPLLVEGFRIMKRDEDEYVVFGPSGGFLISVVPSRGRVNVEDGELQDGTSAEHRAAIEVTDARAYALRWQMMRAGTAVWVHPIVVALHANLSEPVSAAGVIVCPARALPDLLQRRRVLKPQMIARIVSVYMDLQRPQARALHVVAGLDTPAARA